MKILFFLLCLSMGMGSVQAQNSPVLVELFSSENCPACPPADEYMRSLSQMENVIALSCHVNYFGGTSANLGREFCTDRQDLYIKQMGREKYFTPHMVINGHMNEIGYETAKISKLLVQGRGDAIDQIQIHPKAQVAGTGVYDFYLAPKSLRRPANIWLAIYDRPKTVNERGRKVTYYNIVKRMIPLGLWNGSALSRAFYPILDESSLGFAVIAQDSFSGQVLAVGEYKL